MTVYISLLRGINLGSHNKIAMSSLKELFSELGFQNPVTYIQSGNIVFKSKNKDTVEIEKTIRQGINEKFSLDVAVFVKSLGELSKIIGANPFSEDALAKGERVYFTLFSKKPLEESVDKLCKIDGRGDSLAFVDKTVYVLCKKGYARTVFSNNFIEKTLGFAATSRNRETIKKLATLAGGLDYENG